MRCVPLLALAVLAATGPAHAAPETPASEDKATELAASRAELAAALLTETNRVRRAHGRRPLRAKAKLEAAADDQAAFMALTLTTQHTSPIEGQRTVLERVARHGLEGRLVAENVVSYPIGHDTTPPPAHEIATALVARWMASPRHRAHLLDRKFTQFGGAVRLVHVYGKEWIAYGVQVFFLPRTDGRGA